MVKAANPVDTGETVTLTNGPTATTTYTVTTDYLVRPAGVLLVGSGAISATDALLLSYTKHASTRIESLMSSSISGELIIEGLNCAQSGAPVIIRVWSFKPSPAEAFQLISDEFASFTLNGKIAADNTQDPNSLYFQADVATDDGV